MIQVGTPRNQHLNGVSHEFCTGIAEQLFRLRVYQDDRAVIGDDHDRIGSGFEEGAVQTCVGGERLRGDSRRRYRMELDWFVIHQPEAPNKTRAMPSGEEHVRSG